MAERLPRSPAFPCSLPFVPTLEFLRAHGDLLRRRERLRQVDARRGDRRGLWPAHLGRQPQRGRDPAGAGRAKRSLGGYLRCSFARRPRDGYFVRAELQAHFASLLDQRREDVELVDDPYQAYGGRSLHAQSHGEAFLAVLLNRLRSGMFVMDEPESALSPQRRLALLTRMAELADAGRAQFIIATHCPILLTFPQADIISFDEAPLRRVTLEETSHYRITRGILEAPARYWRRLRQGDDEVQPR
jgi:predicted ATPase